MPHPARPRLAAVLLVAALAASTASTAAAATPPGTSAPTSRSAMSESVSNYRRPSPGLLTGGQPAATEWAALAAAGVRTVINLRPAAEMGGRDEAGEVAAAGLGYRELPVGGQADLTLANARALRRLLRDAEGAVLVHCASGNRVGALLALAAAAEDGVGVEQALALGRAAGMTGAEAHTRALLEDPDACRADC